MQVDTCMMLVVAAETRDVDQVFKALADPTRRVFHDRRGERDGQARGELCTGRGMARQSATQHLDVLVHAGLVTVVRRGRVRLHFLNPAPLHDIGERWISSFDRPRLAALSAIRSRAEEYAMTESVPTYVYVTYIRAGAQQVWHALTDADLTARYWGHANVSDWQPGSSWEHRRADGSGAVDVAGRVLEADPPRRLVITFGAPDGDEPPGGDSVVTFVLEEQGGIVRLTVTHENLADAKALGEISHGWPAVLANLKSLLRPARCCPRPRGRWRLPG